MVVPVEDVLELLIERIEAYQEVAPSRAKELALGHLEAALAFLTGPGDGTMADQVCPVIDIITKKEIKPVVNGANVVNADKRCHCGDPGWGENGCCGMSGCNNVPG